MFGKLNPDAICHIPPDMPRLKNSDYARFLKVVENENSLVEEVHQKDIQSTAENPHVRLRNDTEAIAKELHKLKHDEFVREKRRQQLRQNNQDLRLLEIQLRSAYVTKQLSDQKKSIEEDRRRQAEEQKKEDARAEEERLRVIEQCRAEEVEEHRKKTKLRGQLLGQMSESQRKRMQEYEDIMRDRDEMQKKLQRMMAEDEAERRDLMQRKQMTRAQMEEYLRMQEQYKLQERSEKKDEMVEFLKVQQQSDEQKRVQLEQRKALLAQREALSREIGLKLHATESEKKKREVLLLDLLVEERKTKDDQRFKRALERQAENRHNIREELQRYTQYVVVENKNQQQREDELYRAEQMRILAERDKLDQLSNQQRRKKIMEHGRAIQEMIEEKRKQRMRDTAEMMRDHEIRLNQDMNEQHEIEDERLRLLMQQPPEILRFLPTGVLRPTDLQYISVPTAKKEPNVENK